MTDNQMNAWGHQAIDALEKHFKNNPRYTALTTDQLGDFWQGMTEACTLRLVQLKPEMVRHVPPEMVTRPDATEPL